MARENFPADVRAVIRARETLTAGGLPRCFACGEPIQFDLVFHHRKADGPGLIVNGLALHGRLEGRQCHHALVHEGPAKAREYGWIISRHAKLPAAFYVPVWCAIPGRGWIVLDDDGGWQPSSPGTDEEQHG